MPAPKIRLLYFKNILDRCFFRFFEDFNDCFTKTDDGRYILSVRNAPEKIRKYFLAEIKTEILKYAKPFDLFNPEYFFVIGGCDPAENMLLEFKDGYFPKKLSRLLDSGGCPKYVLKEKDIKIDIEFFNSLIDDLFTMFFADHGCFGRLLGKGYDNVFAVKHRQLDCYSVFKVIKYIYGRNSCVNVWKDEFEDKRQCVTAVNDLIDMYVNNKTAMNRSRKFKNIVEEVRQYCDGCINKMRDM